MNTNRHPVDRMADIKSQLAALETEFGKLRAQVLAGEVEPRGTEYKATIAERQWRSIPVTEAERRLPAPLFAELVHVVEHQVVTLRPIRGKAKPPSPWRGYGRRNNRRKGSR